MVKHEFIRDLCGASHYGEEAIRRWLSPVAPPAVKEKRDRPRKNITEEVEWVSLKPFIHAGKKYDAPGAWNFFSLAAIFFLLLLHNSLDSFN
jgi:hypothetical protein